MSGEYRSSDGIEYKEMGREGMKLGRDRIE
jgi:hypothetical protein